MTIMRNGWRASISASLRVLLLCILLCSATSPVRPASAADPITDDNVAERVASAQTAADHEAIAAYFDAQAAAAADKMKMHEKMLTTRQYVGSKIAPSWEMHCKNMIKAYKDAQNGAQALAAAQREMAKESK